MTTRIWWSGLRHRSPDAVQVPRAGHAHVRVQHEAVVPHDLEVLAVALDQLDDATRAVGAARTIVAHRSA